MSNLFRLTSGAAIVSSLLFGATAATLKPARASAQITCWVCVCNGSNCTCSQVACPEVQQNQN